MLYKVDFFIFYSIEHILMLFSSSIAYDKVKLHQWGLSSPLTEIEELRLKAPRPVTTPEGPTSCWPEPIGLLRAVVPPPIFLISL